MLPSLIGWDVYFLGTEPLPSLPPRAGWEGRHPLHKQWVTTSLTSSCIMMLPTPKESVWSGWVCPFWTNSQVADSSPFGLRPVCGSERLLQDVDVLLGSTTGNAHSDVFAVFKARRCATAEGNEFAS